MRNIFYRYNPQTLAYERVYPSKKQRIWGVFRHLLIGAFIGTALFAIAMYAFDSPVEYQLRKENRLLESQFKILLERINEDQKVLKDIQRRDDELYRALFNADPISESMRKSGVGGVNRYQALMDLPFSELVIETTYRLDQLTRQLYVQSTSYDELLELVKTKEERLQCIPAILPLNNNDLRRIGSGFGMRLHPIYGVQKFHAGIDLNAAIGTPIFATGDGVVELSKYSGGYGNCVIIDHGFGYKTVYGHNKENLVKVGQKVTRGQQVATVGMTGDTTGPHLHYEVLVKGQPDNPAKYFFMEMNPDQWEEMLSVSMNQ
ncbi:M23 family metallopeptidase [Bacteroidales bacterium OttesenSCG-928-M11]|nr:M23 family metallopeptidase [Bacteroidales bacterium OttesenSCG-928-M11]